MHPNAPRTIWISLVMIVALLLSGFTSNAPSMSSTMLQITSTDTTKMQGETTDCAAMALANSSPISHHIDEATDTSNPDVSHVSVDNASHDTEHKNHCVGENASNAEHCQSNSIHNCCSAPCANAPALFTHSTTFSSLDSQLALLILSAPSHIVRRPRSLFRPPIV